MLGMAVLIKSGNKYYLLVLALTRHFSSCKLVFINSIFHGHHGFMLSAIFSDLYMDIVFPVSFMMFYVDFLCPFVVIKE